MWGKWRLTGSTASAIIGSMSLSAQNTTAYRLIALLAVLIVTSGGLVAFLDAHDDACECSCDCSSNACHSAALINDLPIALELHPCGGLSTDSHFVSLNHLDTPFRPPQA